MHPIISDQRVIGSPEAGTDMNMGTQEIISGSS